MKHPIDITSLYKTQKKGRPLEADNTTIYYNNTIFSMSTNTTTSLDKTPLIYDLLLKDESTVSLNISEEERKDKMLVIIATILAQLVAKGDKIKSTNKQFRSSSGRLPPISLEAYIARLLQYAPCDKECFLTALVYMDRLIERVGFIFNSMNIHRSYLTALMLAAKFFEDQPCDNGYFATVGGVSVPEMNNMELTFLSLIDFRIAITPYEFNLYAQVTENKSEALERPKLLCNKEAISPDTSASSLGLVIKSALVPAS
eukprot:TRINITY_DN32048_c0_g1_i1.p1 TRINITY_DN32048_c0_g1~~TRINITY_DN32048_c0_g1_i1.p1  ORF type:complete len:258 (+),score=72.29 TRINITY_DN32048_c0_g1_i1:85-858(+)